MTATTRQPPNAHFYTHDGAESLSVLLDTLDVAGLTRSQLRKDLAEMVGLAESLEADAAALSQAIHMLHEQAHEGGFTMCQAQPCVALENKTPGPAPYQLWVTE